MGANDDGSEAGPRKEWWWVVEWSEYIRKQYPGAARYAVVPSSRLNEYRDILCKVRYSSEAAAVAAAERGGELLCAWEVVWWPRSSIEKHPGTSRYEAIPESDIQRFWSAGAKSVQGGLAHADAVAEAARRCALPERWCVVRNNNSQTKESEPYTVKPAQALSLSEKDQVRATCNSEQDAWQAIPGVQAEDERRMKADKQRYEEWERTERRREYFLAIPRVTFVITACVGLVVALIWLLVTLVHWFWQHPLF